MRPYADRDHVDRLVDDHLTPGIYPDDDEPYRTARTARAEHFNELRGHIPAARTARTTWDVTGTAPAPSAPSSPRTPSAGAGAQTFERPGTDTAPGRS